MGNLKDTLFGKVVFSVWSVLEYVIPPYKGSDRNWERKYNSNPFPKFRP